MSVVETRSIFSKPCINGKCYQEKIHQKYAHEQKKKVKLQFFQWFTYYVGMRYLHLSFHVQTKCMAFIQSAIGSQQVS